MTEQELYNHVLNDPDGIGLSWALTDEALLTALHNKGLFMPTPTIKARVLQWSGGNGLLDRLNTNQTAHPIEQIRSVCRAAMLMFQDATISTIDFNEPENQALLGALVAGGVMTQAEKDDLMNRYARQAASTLEKVFGVGTGASPGMIQRARKAGT